MLKHFLLILLASLSVSALSKPAFEQINDLESVNEERCKVYNKRCFLVAIWSFDNIERHFDLVLNLENKNDTVGSKILYFTRYLDSFSVILRPYSYNLETIEMMKNNPNLFEKDVKDEMIKEVEKMKNDVSYVGDNETFFNIVAEILNTIKKYIGKIDEEMGKVSSIIENIQVNAVSNKAAVILYEMYQIENRANELIEVTQYLRDLLV